MNTAGRMLGEMIRMVVCLVLSGAMSLLQPGCTPCNRSGCDAVGTPATNDGRSGIAGVVAYESDVVANGCQECPLSSAALSLWLVSAPPTDSASADSIVKGQSPAVTIQADGFYRQALDAGGYLLCVRGYCVYVEVLPDHTTPVNVLQVFGPVQFKVFDPLTRAAEAAPTFTTTTW